MLLPTALVAQTVTTTAGGLVGDGRPAIKASFEFPEFVAQDAAGNLYIGDISAQRVRKVSTSGVISTFAGTGIAGFSGDGGPSSAAMLAVGAVLPTPGPLA